MSPAPRPSLSRDMEVALGAEAKKRKCFRVVARAGGLAGWTQIKEQGVQQTTWKKKAD